MERLAQAGVRSSVKASVVTKTRNRFITPSTCASSNGRNSRILATFTNRGTAVSGAESAKGSASATMLSVGDPMFSSVGSGGPKCVSRRFLFRPQEEAKLPLAEIRLDCENIEESNNEPSKELADRSLAALQCFEKLEGYEELEGDGVLGK